MCRRSRPMCGSPRHCPPSGNERADIAVTARGRPPPPHPRATRVPPSAPRRAERVGVRWGDAQSCDSGRSDRAAIFVAATAAFGRLAMTRFCDGWRPWPRLTRQAGHATMSGMYEPGGAARRSAARGVGAAVALAAMVMVALAGVAARAADLPVVRVGVLKFGTVSWELDVLRRHGLDRAHGVVVEPLELAGKDGAAVALQGGAVDVILTDWLWVARRRALGGDFTFVPHSHATGGVMVRKGGDIKSIADLKGRKIGIGGGPVDKSWL